MTREFEKGQSFNDKLQRTFNFLIVWFRVRFLNIFGLQRTRNKAEFIVERILITMQSERYKKYVLLKNVTTKIVIQCSVVPFM